jgi:tetratricopeptide (TPR) repeat protein
VTNANRKRQLAVETAAKEGLRASVPLYIAAAEAFAQEDRPAQGLELLGELLRAKEKRRGLLGRVEKNPLGPERARVAIKYAELAHSTSPTEDSLEMLADLANEFADVAVVRRANADGLRNAGYAADAIDEYRYSWKLEPEDGDIPVRLSELYAALGRSDEAAEHLRRGIAAHAAAGQFEQVADRAMRFIDLNPDELDDVFNSMEMLPGEVLKKHVPSLDHLGVLVRRDPARDADWRTRMEQRLIDLYSRVLETDNRNGAARRGINVLGPNYLADVEAKLRAAPPRPATPAVPATPPATPAQASVQPAAPAPQAHVETDETSSPELVEKSPGELVEETLEPVASAAPASASPAQPAAEQPAAQQPAAEPAKAPASTPSRAIYAFALRKAQEQYDAGSYQEAAQACDRILKRGDIPEVLMLLAHCYMKMDRKSEAVSACMRFADAQAAQDPTKALDALTDLIKEVPDPALILRRSQLLSVIRQVERV